MLTVSINQTNTAEYSTTVFWCVGLIDEIIDHEDDETSTCPRRRLVKKVGMLSIVLTFWPQCLH